MIRYQCGHCGHPTEFHDAVGCIHKDDDDWKEQCHCPNAIRDLADDKPDSGVAGRPGLTTGQEWL